jgi:O-antigen ligase
VKDTTPEVLLLLLWVVVTRIGYLHAAKLGIEFGPIPLFLTDITLISLFALSLVNHPARCLVWMTSGSGAGASGYAVWLLCLVAFVYFVCALRDYGVFALRDLAIYCYCFFFPLVFFAVQNRRTAIKITRYFVYSGVVLGGLLVLEWSSGLNTGLFSPATRVFSGHNFYALGSDDVGGIIAFALSGLFAYIALGSDHRLLHTACAILCLLGLAISTVRSATLGVALSAGLTFIALDNRRRVIFCGVFGFAVLCSLAIAFAPPAVPLSGLFRSFYSGLVSGTTDSADPTAKFRVLRWDYAVNLWLTHPILGVGFGVPIIPSYLVDRYEFAGKFNSGMPHNSFLFLLERTGLFGFALVTLCWLSGIVRLLRHAKQAQLADDLAVANILIAMVGFGSFVLFLERPMNDAAFWIVAAVGQRMLRTPYPAANADLG